MAGLFEDFFHEFEVLRMDLIGLFRCFAGQNQVQGDLIGLVHDGARAGGHPADMELEDAGDVAEIFVGTGDKFFDGIGLSGVGPEDDDVGEHKFNLRRILKGTSIRASKELSGT